MDQALNEPVPNDELEFEDEGSLSHHDLAKLIQQARDGDGEALGQLVNDCQAYLLFIANQDLDIDLRSKLGASDIVQQSVMVAQQKFGQFEGSTRQELLAWLRGILFNDLRETRRHYKKSHKRKISREANKKHELQGLPLVQDSICTPGTQASIKEESRRLHVALRQLSSEQQQVLRLRNWQHQSFSEIGIQIGKTAEASRKIWSRAVLELERVLIEQGQINRHDK